MTHQTLLSKNPTATELHKHQRDVLDKLRSGSILVGGVGSGKSRVGLVHYCRQHYPKKLYIITTAKKRDTAEWEYEMYDCFDLREQFESVDIVIDSWNNIKKYKDVEGAFFIFDEQKVIGSGAWVKAFLKITKTNEWILLTATPGDTWMDYIPVFLANGFYKNRTAFIYRHVVPARGVRYFKVGHYVDVLYLNSLRDSITINMDYEKHTIAHHEWIDTGYDRNKFEQVRKGRWNPYTGKPIRDAAEFYYVMRRVVNSDFQRLDIVTQLLDIHPKVIVFYNFNYELELLVNLCHELAIPAAQWNGHRHEPIPSTDQWVYLVQYAAGAEGWNCVETNVVIFYSQNYSYKATIQAAGRIDRLNTLFVDLWYYHLRSTSWVDVEIKKAYDRKQDFNERRSMAKSGLAVS